MNHTTMLVDLLKLPFGWHLACIHKMFCISHRGLVKDQDRQLLGVCHGIPGTTA